MGVEIEGSTLPEELPPLPRGWRYEALGDLVDERGVCYGIVQPGSADARGVPIVRVNNIRDGRIDTTNILRVSPGVESKFGRSRLRGGEVLLTLVGTLGEVAVVPHDLKGWNVARAVGVIPVREDPGAQWVAVCLRSGFIQRCIRAWATTTVQATFNLRDLAKLPIPVPPTRQRGGITSVLGALDDKIDLNRRMCQTLEEMARVLFKSWFVDFDPVRAKMEGRDPGLPKEIADLFPSRLVDSELGPIPEGWRVASLGELACPRRELAQSEELDEQTNYIGLEHMPRRSIALADWSTSEAVESSKFRFAVGDILFGKLRPYFHKVGVAPIDGVCSTDIVVARPTAPEMFGVTLGVMSSDVFVAHTDRSSAGTRMPRTNWADMSSFRLVTPSRDVAEVHTRAVKSMVDRIVLCIHESRTLAALRDTLLPKLISGELRVPVSLGAAQEVAS